MNQEECALAQKDLCPIIKRYERNQKTMSIHIDTLFNRIKELKKELEK